MKRATLVTNTDFSAFAVGRPLADAKFAGLVSGVRPDWTVEVFRVWQGDFPADLLAHDWIMVTGSPASVTDADLWIETLQGMLRRVVAEGLPLLGACFGNQIIAKVLGAQVIRIPNGRAHGLLDVTRVGDMPWSGRARTVRLFGSLVEQVDRLPERAARIFESPGCPVAGFAIATTVFTVQNNPEMSSEFFADLVTGSAAHVGPDATKSSRASLVGAGADGPAFAEEIARFF